MIVQSAPQGQDPLVIEQLEHTRLSGRFAEIWGNEDFDSLHPRDLMLFVIAHHDQGWDAVDENVGRDDETGLPWNLTKTPLPQVLKTGTRGPEFNEKRHPYCGLISSMHTYGLYHGRYGLSDKVFVDLIPGEHKAAVLDMLATEQARQERLKAVLADSPETEAWVREDMLFHNYKLLQFFDTLSLYFNCTHEAARGESTFLNVPRGVANDVEVRVKRTQPGVYAFDPFPFRESGLEVSFEAIRLAPQPAGTSIPEALAAAPRERETFKVVRA